MPTADLPAGFTALRAHQATAIDEVVSLFDEGYDIVYLDAPTGSGKTLIGHQVARELEAKALYVCSDKSLQDQFARDFKHAAVLKGRGNYEVGQRGETAADCTIVDKKTDACLFCPHWSECPYEIAKIRALGADLACTNTYYFLTEANGPGGFSNRDLVIVDEADTLESILMGYVEYRAPSRIYKKLGMVSPKKGAHKKTLVAWLDEFSAKLESRLGQGTMFGDPDEIKQLRYALSDARRVRVQLLADMERGEDDEDKGTWLRDYDWSRDANADPGLILKPVKVNTFGVRNLWRHGQRWLIMSATIISSDEMSDSLGVVGDYETVTVPMTFPVENREIILAPIADVTYQNMDEAILDLAHAIEVAALRHEDERMIIHTVSYKLARDLEDQLKRGEYALKGRKIITYSEGRHRERALRDFKNTPGAVLLAPSMTRGIDLPDDLCRVQIIAKCPFPFLGDKQVNARLHTENGQMWYTVKTIRDIVQMTGRAIRHEDDWAVTYIFDRSFTKNLWGRWKRLFPEWWREAVTTSADVREFIRR